jgi:LysR family transcriptional regulator, regulator for genes of the gallate degradation pathway
MTMPQRLPNLRHLQAVCEVLRRGSVSAAAAAVHLSQPAVTQAIGLIERSLATRLFARSSVGMEPTEAGRLSAARIARALEHIRAGLAEARRVRPRRSPATALALTSTQLEALAITVEHGGFGAAARAAGSTRAALHRAVRQLERTLDAALFERTSYGVRPTREAELLVRRVRLAQGELEQARAELSALAGGDRGRTVIGAMPLARSFLVPGTVLEFGALHPEHTISILDGPYESMLGALRQGTADLLVGALREPVPHDDVVQEHLFDDPLAIVVRAGHPLARRKRLTVRMLADYPWIAPRPGSPLRRQFDELCRAAGAGMPASAIECNSLVAARALLVASDRVMLLSAHQIHHELATGQLVALPHPLGAVTRPIGLTTRRDWRPTATQLALLDLLRRRVRALV